MKDRERRARLKTPTAVSELVDRVLSGYHISEDVRRRRIVTEWSRIVGRKLATRTQPGRIQEGVLDVRVANSSWLHQMSFLTDELVQRVNQTVGKPTLIHDIRWVLGRPRIERGSPTRVDRVVRVSNVIRPRAAPPARASAIARESDAVDDDELRDLIRDVRTRYDL